MKKITLLLLSVLISSTMFAQEVVTAWTFDDLSAATDSTTSSLVINSNTDIGTLLGTAAIYADGSNGSSALTNSGASPEFTSFGGNVMNDPRTSTSAGDAIAIANSTANGKFIVFKYSMTGYQNAVLTYATRGSSTGFSTQEWSYSTDGTNFTVFETVPSQQNSTWVTKTIDFTAATAIDEAAVVYLKLTVNGATSASGNNRFDNFVITANTAGPDITAPNVSAIQVLSNNSIKVTFNEELNTTTAQNVANYGLVDANAANYTISGATLSNLRYVTLTISTPIAEGSNYTISISNVSDVAGNVMEAYTSNFTYGVSSQYHVADIAELRTKFPFVLNDNRYYDSIVYKLSGDVIVTAIAEFNHQKVIQDASGAILIFDEGNKLGNLEVGDKVNGIYGTLTNYYGFLEFVPTQPYTTFVDDYNAVVPLEITLAQLNDNEYMIQHQAELLKINNVSIASTGLFAKLNRYELTQNGTTSPALFPYFQDVDYIGEAIPTGVNQNITGFNFATGKIGSDYFDFKYYIIPRKKSDMSAFVNIQDINNQIIRIYPNPTSDFVTVDLNNSQATSLQLFDVYGKLVLCENVVNHSTVSMQNLPAGMYLIKVLNNDQIIGVSKIIKK